jgi:hypothetical protein
MHLNGTAKKGSSVQSVGTPSEFDAEIKNAFKTDTANVKRFSGLVDFSQHVKGWLAYSGFGSTSSTSQHAIAQGYRDPSILHMHFFKDDEGVTRMHKYNEILDVLLPPVPSKGVRVFKADVTDSIDEIITDKLPFKIPLQWPELDTVKKNILENPRLSTEQKIEWEHYFSLVPSNIEDLTEENTLSFTLRSLFEKKSKRTSGDSTQRTIVPIVTERTFAYETLIHEDHPASAAAIERREREEYNKAQVDALREAAEAEKLSQRSNRKRKRIGAVIESQTTQQQSSDSDEDTSQHEEDPQNDSTVMDFEGSVLSIGENLLLFPDKEGVKKDISQSYKLGINIGNVLNFNHKTKEIFVHWYYAKKLDGLWMKWIDKARKPYQEWVHSSAFINDKFGRIVRVTMEKAKGPWSRGKTKLSKDSLAVVMSIKVE